MTTTMLRAATVASLIGFSLMAVPAFAATENFTATLTGSAETPPTTSTGTGLAKIKFDTKTDRLSWVITYKGLTGKAVAAHFHGPAAAGASAPPVVPLKHKLTSPIRGYVKLTAKEAAELEKGLLYFNIHTAKFPNGEIRGQVLKAK